jgi:putative ABC transport system permease protein
MDVFIDEANESINMVYGTLDANDALYNSLVGSIDSLGQISNVLVIVVIIAGLGILGLINALTINERREEIGILLAIGESKLKIIGQFIVEIALISLIAFSLSAVTGSIIGKRVTDSLLDSDMITNNLELGSGQLTTNEQGGKNNRVAGGGFNQMNPMMNVEPVEFDVSLSFGVLLQIYGLGLMLAITSTMIPALHVMRYNPKQILSNRES